MAKRKLTKKQRETRNRFIIAIILAVVIFGIGYTVGSQQTSSLPFKEYFENTVQDVKNWWQNITHPSESDSVEMPVEIHVFDVGQGSSILLQANDGTNVLIDTGPNRESELMTYLDKYIGSGGNIDVLILTHNDSDHIGMAAEVLTYYQVGEVWMNGVDADTDTYIEVLEAVESSGTRYVEPKAGYNTQVGPFDILVMHPTEESNSTDQNRNSIATWIKANGMSVVQTGDASKTDERHILDRFNDVRANVLIAGHHGSDTSSSEEWVAAVEPDLAIYSAGLGNSYGHPSPETVDTFEELNIPLYGTDVNGNVHIYSDEYGVFHYEVERNGSD